MLAFNNTTFGDSQMLVVSSLVLRSFGVVFRMYSYVIAIGAEDVFFGGGGVCRGCKSFSKIMLELKKSYVCNEVDLNNVLG